LAEDVLQTSLLKALRAAPDLRDEKKLLPWFYQILNRSIWQPRAGGSAARCHVQQLQGAPLAGAPGAAPAAGGELSAVRCAWLSRLHL
jgi:DNA-directed RNA polymerase specialized sigma24 family protein